MADRLEKLSRTLNRALRGLDMDQRVKESRAMALWPDVVGEVTAARAKPLHVNRGTMVVAVSSSAWANQLNLMKPRFLEAIAARLGPGVIQDLRWRVAENRPEGEAGGAGPVSPAPARVGDAGDAAAALPAAEAAAIDAHVAAIADPKLAARMRRTLTAQAARRARLAAAGWTACRACGVLHDPADPAGTAEVCPPCLLGVREVTAGGAT